MSVGLSLVCLFVVCVPVCQWVNFFAHSSVIQSAIESVDGSVGLLIGCLVAGVCFVHVPSFYLSACLLDCGT